MGDRGSLSRALLKKADVLPRVVSFDQVVGALASAMFGSATGKLQDYLGTEKHSTALACGIITFCEARAL